MEYNTTYIRFKPWQLILLGIAFALLGEVFAAIIKVMRGDNSTPSNPAAVSTLRNTNEFPRLYEPRLVENAAGSPWITAVPIRKVWEDRGEQPPYVAVYMDQNFQILSINRLPARRNNPGFPYEYMFCVTRTNGAQPAAIHFITLDYVSGSDDSIDFLPVPPATLKNMERDLIAKKEAAKPKP